MMNSKYDINQEQLFNLCKYPCKYRVPAFRIFGNLFYVGNADVGAHIIDTGDGLILIDTTFPSTSALLIQSIWELGFKPGDIRMILHTHGHFDHFGATELLVQLSGATTYLGKEDAEMFRQRPELALCDCCSGYAYAEPFVPDVELVDQDCISLGNTVVRAIATPGHSAGVMSFFFDVTDGKNTYRAGLCGGAGVNTLTAGFMERYHIYGAREQYLHSLEKLRGQRVDITLGNHSGQNHTLEKRRQMQKCPDSPNPFVDPGEWNSFLDTASGIFQQMLVDEQRIDCQ